MIHLKLVFKGTVELGDECRVSSDSDQDGAMIIGGRDVVGEIENVVSSNEFSKDRIIVGIADETFDGIFSLKLDRVTVNLLLWNRMN